MDINCKEFISICKRIDDHKFEKTTINDIDQSIIDEYICILEKIADKKWDEFTPEDTKYRHCNDIADVRNFRLWNNL